MNLPARFLAKIDKTGTCWEWTGARDRKGYGRLRLPNGHIGAHRYMYLAVIGPIPPGMEVCHSCDNPPCVTPAHLWLGSHGANMADMLAKGRGSRPPHAMGDQHWTRRNPAWVQRGEASGLARLSDLEVEEMRDRRETENLSLRELASVYGISKSQAGRIVRREQR